MYSCNFALNKNRCQSNVVNEPHVFIGKENKYKNIVGKYKILVTLQPCSYPNHWSLVLLPTTGGFQGESTSCFLRLSSRFIMSITSDRDFLWAVLLRSWSSPDYNIGNANTSRSGAKIIKDTHHFSIFAEHLVNQYNQNVHKNINKHYTWNCIFQQF